MSIATFTPRGDLRVQLVNHRDGRRSYVVLDLATGSVHGRSDRFLASFSEGTQRTYAYHLIDHLRWLAVTERPGMLSAAQSHVALQVVNRHRVLDVAGR